MIGDSLIEWFDWSARFPEHDVINLGISGETVEWMLDRLPHVTQSYPGADRVFILTGINNIAMEDTGIIKPYSQALSELKEAYPKAMLYVISLLPTRLAWIKPETITSMNAKLSELALEQGAAYIDAHSVYMRHELRQLLTEDGIHISQTGYAVLSAEVARHITE